jgi:hypothetical protein
MMRQKKLSGRKLGDEIGLSEGTIRNLVHYAEASKLRNCYAREHKDGNSISAEDEIARLSVKQVRTYVELPANQRD